MIWIVRTTAISVIAGMLMAASGCGAGGTPQPADSSKAREALLAALESWKAGEKPEDLENRSPAIHVKDVDWGGGFRLIGYKVDAGAKLAGYDMNYPVALELKSPRGVAVKKNAVYTVTTHPEPVIARQEG